MLDVQPLDGIKHVSGPLGCCSLFNVLLQFVQKGALASNLAGFCSSLAATTAGGQGSGVCK
jgi:hypothetical protein